MDYLRMWIYFVLNEVREKKNIMELIHSIISLYLM